MVKPISILLNIYWLQPHCAALCRTIERDHIITTGVTLALILTSQVTLGDAENNISLCSEI